MYYQQLIPIKNYKQINDLLEQGWRFQYVVGTKLALLEKFRNQPGQVMIGEERAEAPTTRGN